MLVACALVNRSRWVQAAPVLATLRDRWPDPAALASADASRVEPLVSPLGLGAKRSANLIGLAEGWLRRPPASAEDVLTLPGCGEYAADSWAMFVEGRRDRIPSDAKLLGHVRRGWRKVPHGVLDLFSGIGGFSLGLERTGGFRTVAFCEVDPFRRGVLARHWPEVPCYDDIRGLTAARLAADGVVPEVLCGGFPCTDVSDAGAKVGILGERSGLWSEYARLVGELRPRYVVVENVGALLARGFDRVLGDLAALGYDAEWHCVPASAVGAAHLRERIWIVAWPRDRIREDVPPGEDVEEDGEDADLDGWRQPGRREDRVGAPWLGGWLVARLRCADGRSFVSKDQPFLGRGVHGIPHRLDRVKALENAVVPANVEALGAAILDAEWARSVPAV